jgi:hypothetical protein
LAVGVFFGVFLVLHGWVHLVFGGHSLGMFQLRPGLTWPDGSWALRSWLGPTAIRRAATVACVLAALGFVVAGVALVLDAEWWRDAALASAAFSSLAFVLLWDGTRRRLADQGALGVLINVAVVVAALVTA